MTFFCLLCASLLSESDDCPLKHSIIVFSKARPAVPAVGIATPHPSHTNVCDKPDTVSTYIKHLYISVISSRAFKMDRNTKNVHCNSLPTPPVLSPSHSNWEKTHTHTERRLECETEKKNSIKFVLFRSLLSRLPLSQGLQFHSNI